MLDLITLISTMGVQQELADTQDKRVAIRETEGHEQEGQEEGSSRIPTKFDSSEGGDVGFLFAGFPLLEFWFSCCTFQCFMKAKLLESIRHHCN